MKKSGVAKKILPLGPVLIIFLVAISFLPKKFEKIFGHPLEEISRCSITVVRDDMYSNYFELSAKNREDLVFFFADLGFKPVKRVNYISHKNGFGYYHIVFTDAQSYVLEPTIQVDYSGNIYIRDVQYQMIGSRDLLTLLESISEPRIR